MTDVKHLVFNYLQCMVDISSYSCIVTLEEGLQGEVYTLKRLSQFTQKAQFTQKDTDKLIVPEKNRNVYSCVCEPKRGFGFLVVLSILYIIRYVLKVYEEKYNWIFHEVFSITNPISYSPKSLDIDIFLDEP